MRFFPRMYVARCSYSENLDRTSSAERRVETGLPQHLDEVGGGGWKSVGPLGRRSVVSPSVSQQRIFLHRSNGVERW